MISKENSSMPFKLLGDNKIQLQGELNFLTVPALRKEFMKLLPILAAPPQFFDSTVKCQKKPINYLPSQSHIVVDLAAVGPCDSAGPALMLELVRLSLAAQKTIKFINIPAQLQALMHATAITEILPVE